MLDEIESLARSDAAKPAAGTDTPPGILEFGYEYFPHFCEKPPSHFHTELTDELSRMIMSPDTQRFACAAPRGIAKTTWVSLIFVLYCVAYRLKNFVIVITSASSQASQLMRDIQEELISNQKLAEAFPEMVGRGRTWNEEEVITANGIKILMLGAGKSIRGRRHREHRPDLFVIDDLENDERVRNPEQREKLWDWLLKVVLKAKGIAKKADYLVIGTILHFDSVLARLLDRRRAPGWRGKVYRSVINYSDRPDLWETWENLYTDWTKHDAERQESAQSFFDRNREQMLMGTEVLWPEVETYDELMKVRIDEGRASFDSEKQNQPINPSDCAFLEEWFRQFDEIEVDGEAWIQVENGARFPLSDCDMYGATDPSMGKNDKGRDPSAIITIAAYPKRGQSDESGYSLYCVLDADIRRRHPHIILRDIHELHRRRQYVRHGIEVVQFQELFADDVQEAAWSDPTVADLHIVKMRPNTDKMLRIQKLIPFVANGRLVFNRRLATLFRQMRYWPQDTHDDGPDALALCLETINSLGVRFFLAEPLEEPRRTESEIAKEQIEAQLPLGISLDPPDQSLTCATCAYLVKYTGSRLKCGLVGDGVTEDMPACWRYDFNCDLR